MLNPDEWTSGVEVVGQLSILADDAPLDVAFGDDVVRVTLPDFRTALRLRNKFSSRDRRAWIRSIQAILARAGLELQVWVRDHQVGRLSPTSQVGWVSGWLGVGPLELEVRGLLRSLVRRKPGVIDSLSK